MRREERVSVQGPVKEQQPDGMSHRGDDPRRGHDAARNAYGHYAARWRNWASRTWLRGDLDMEGGGQEKP